MKYQLRRILFLLTVLCTLVVTVFVARTYGAPAAFVVATAMVSTLAFAARGYALGVAMPQINVETVSDLTSLSADAREKLWVKRILKGSESENVFSDNMTGPLGSGKAFISYDDVTKVDGNTVVITTLANLGGAGSQGASLRTSNEEKLRIGTFNFQIGRQWYGVGIDDVAKEETVIGSQFDQNVNELLRKRLGKKKTDDLMKRLVADATSSNTVRPNYKTSREALKTTDVVSTSLVTKAGVVASSNGARAMTTGRSEAGAPIEKYLFFSNQFAMIDLKTESSYLEAVRMGQERGNKNEIFAGGYTDWDGHGLYEWKIRDHDAFGPVGGAILPRAFLGTQIDNTLLTGSAVISGGGSAAAASVTPAPLFFEFFSNYGYAFANGQSINADTTTDRYALIQVLTGSDAGKWCFINFRVNSGSTITIRKACSATNSGNYANTVGNITFASGVWDGSTGNATMIDPQASAVPIGSLIIETNSYGVPFGYSFMLGEHAAACGHGSLKGRSAIAARTEEHLNHGMHHGIGMETVWGCNTVQRTDGKTPNYVLIEHAISYDGIPSIV